MNPCKICHQPTQLLFEATLLKKHPVSFFQCDNCRFIQTETPYWLAEAYQYALSPYDMGLVARNLSMAEKTVNIIEKHFRSEASFLDYGGGTGLFVRLMRDKGYDFYRQDPYSTNLFAQNFDIATVLPPINSFELITAFEVFEHLEQPIENLKNILNYSSSVLFSTELQPQKTFKSAKDWDYFSLQTGQHIAFHTRESLEYLAQSVGKKLYTNNRNLHLITDRPLSILPNNLGKLSFQQRLTQRISRKISTWYQPKVRKSLLQSDYEKFLKQTSNAQ